MLKVRFVHEWNNRMVIRRLILRTAENRETPQEQTGGVPLLLGFSSDPCTNHNLQW